MLLFEEEQFLESFVGPFIYILLFEVMPERKSVSYSEMQQEKIRGVGAVGMTDGESLASPDVNILTSTWNLRTRLEVFLPSRRLQS